MKKKDWLFIVAIVCVAGIFWLGRMLLAGQGNEVVIVTVDGKVYGTYNLFQDQEVDINDSNVLIIKDQVADMTEANCPDKLCVHQKSISKDGESIICLPNKVIAEVHSEEESELDAVTN